MILEIGKPYHNKFNNCTHTVSRYFNSLYKDNLEWEEGFEWDGKFLFWMRRRFKPCKPQPNALITCNPKGQRHQIHVAVLREGNRVYHNSNSQFSDRGETMEIALFMFETQFENLRFYEWQI